MIEQSKYLPRQMNGPVLNSVMQALDKSLVDSGEIEDYLHGVSLATANEADLESIGCLIGYPRPLVPEGFNLENILLLGSLPLEQDESVGLATINSEIGGQLSSSELEDTGFMDMGTYRKMLEKVALIKRYGVSIKSVDQIAALVSQDYSITWNEDCDIELTFTDSIGYKNVWILSQLFYRLCTAPQVIVSSGV